MHEDPARSVFGDLEVRLDPWQIDQGPELPGDLAREQDEESVALDVDVPPSDWSPVRPRAERAPGALLFLDGVRRLEARLVVRRGEARHHGAFGSHATGCVRATERGAVIGAPRVSRALIVGGGACVPAAVDLGHGLVYEPLSTSFVEPE